MKRILPDDVYKKLPCSVVAVGSALKTVDRNVIKGLFSADLKSDGYLSLRGMNDLVRANLSVTRRDNFKRGQRPCLRDFCHGYSGRAVLCLLGHYVYIEKGDYYSFFFNGDDQVVSAWYLD